MIFDDYYYTIIRVFNNILLKIGFLDRNPEYYLGSQRVNINRKQNKIIQTNTITAYNRIVIQFGFINEQIFKRELTYYTINNLECVNNYFIYIF